jgi:hypothetical protein
MRKTDLISGTRNGALALLYRIALVLALVLLAVGLNASVDNQADDIMARADDMNRAHFEKLQLTMQLLEEGKVRASRELVWYFVNEGNIRSSLLKFTAPPSIQGDGVLIIEDNQQPNAVWNYLSATRSVRRIAGEHRQNRFMGTEMVFEDFEGLKRDLYEYRILRSYACPQSGMCYVIEGQANNADERNTSSYSKKIFWINRDNKVIVKIDLYNKSGVLEKVCEMSGMRLISGYWRPKRETMTNLLNGRATVLLEEERKLNQPFDKYFISQQYLRSE